MATSLEIIEPRPHCWEVSAITTAPSLLPQVLLSLHNLTCFTRFNNLGCVRLTLFRNKNMWSGDLKRYVWRF